MRRRFGDPIPTPLRWAVIAPAVAGAALGARLGFWLEDPLLTWRNVHNPAYLLSGKTIVGALAGGLLAVELVKRYVGLRESTGDLYAVPLATGIATGRLGCFFTGLSDNTCGTPSKLPWAVDFGDGIPRHPTQLYEILFLLFLIPPLFYVLKRISPGCAVEDSIQNPRFLPGDAFRLFMVSYVTFRLLCDFIKPYPRLFLGLGGIQWGCVLLLFYYFRDIVRWLSNVERVT